MAALCGPWPIPAGCDGGIPVDPAERTPEQAFAVAFATEILWRLSGRQFGACQRTVRPCRTGCNPPSAYQVAERAAAMHAPIAGAAWLPMPITCGCTGDCGCGPICEVRIDGPVVSVDAITVDGVELVAGTDYIVYSGGRIVRTGTACWPRCQDLTAPIGAAGTWSITYTRGVPVPPGGQRSVAALANEILKACGSAPGDCILPSRLQTITREGVTMVLDTTDVLDAGRLGVPVIDMWLAAVNPNRQKAPPAVWSPDTRRNRRQVTP